MNKLEKKIVKRLIGGFVLTLCLTVLLTGFGTPSALAVSILPGVNQPGNTGPDNNKEAIQARINELLQQIAAVKAELKQLRLEMQLLLQEKQQLLQHKPQPPKVNSDEASASYRKALADWQGKMDELNDKIARKQQETNNKQAELAKLEKVRADLQRKLPQ
jgi:chromosome segregation ATPase